MRSPWASSGDARIQEAEILRQMQAPEDPRDGDR